MQGLRINWNVRPRTPYKIEIWATVLSTTSDRKAGPDFFYMRDVKIRNWCSRGPQKRCSLHILPHSSEQSLKIQSCTRQHAYASSGLWVTVRTSDILTRNLHYPHNPRPSTTLSCRWDQTRHLLFLMHNPRLRFHRNLVMDAFGLQSSWRHRNQIVVC